MSRTVRVTAEPFSRLRRAAGLRGAGLVFARPRLALRAARPAAAADARRGAAALRRRGESALPGADALGAPPPTEPPDLGECAGAFRAAGAGALVTGAITALAGSTWAGVVTVTF